MSFDDRHCKFHLNILSRLKVVHTGRPATYQEILSSPAMISLPAKITQDEQDLVDAVIPNIDPASVYED